MVKLSVVSKDLGRTKRYWHFSPDEKYLYVTNWDIRDIYITRKHYGVMKCNHDGTLKNGKIFFDWNLTEDEEALGWNEM